MKYYILFLFSFCFFCQNSNENHNQTEQTHYTNYVNPMIGTGWKGHTYPGASLPFGLVQLSPDNGIPGWDRISGYHYNDSIISGFSHTHLSGTGIGDLYDISFFPIDFQYDQPDYTDNSVSPYYSRFSHDNETAAPGYYSVYLDDYHVQAELTVSERSGFHLYHFDEKSKPAVFVDLSRAMNWDKTINGEIEIENDSIIKGRRFSEGWAKNQKTFFYAVFSVPFDSSYYDDDNLGFPQGRLILLFPEKLQLPLSIKVGISHVSEEQAKKNLLTEIAHWDFQKTKIQADSIWNQELGKIQAEIPDTNERIKFYTSLYQSMLAPTLMSDVDGTYRGFDDKMKHSKYNVYSTFSLWDTFRAAHPLFTFLHEDRVNEMIHSMMIQYEETGVLPVWPLMNNETNCMIGIHSIPVILDAVNKGLTDIETDELFAAADQSLNQDKPELIYYKNTGFIPDKIHNSVSKQLEYCYNDWCVYKLSEKLKLKEKTEEYRNRSMFYKNLFDVKTLFFRGKDEKSNWIAPFDGDEYTKEYMESNAWHYLFFVPHDIPGLIQLMGGNDSFEMMLDSMFQHEPEADDKLPIFSTGMIGQYVHGNEPDHHVPYLYQYIQRPHKTEKMVRRIMSELYSNKPEGLCGNEDCGQLSSWFVFSALGFYPVNPADGKYILGSPIVDKAVVKLNNGNEFVIQAINQSIDNVYVEKVELNGIVLDRCFLYDKEIRQGGRLVFYMTSEMK